MIYEEFRLIQKAEAHSEPSQTQLKVINYFLEKLNPRYLTGFWKRLWKSYITHKTIKMSKFRVEVSFQSD